MWGGKWWLTEGGKGGEDERDWVRKVKKRKEVN